MKITKITSVIVATTFALVTLAVAPANANDDAWTVPTYSVKLCVAESLAEELTYYPWYPFDGELLIPETDILDELTDHVDLAEYGIVGVITLIWVRWEGTIVAGSGGSYEFSTPITDEEILLALLDGPDNGQVIVIVRDPEIEFRVDAETKQFLAEYVAHMVLQCGL